MSSISDDPAPQSALPSINTCARCRATILSSATHDSRHALPCCHVYCGNCVSALAGEQKASESEIKCSECPAMLAPVSEFLTAWCTQRKDRIDAQLRAALEDQGNVSAEPGGPPTPIDHRVVLCPEHKTELSLVDAATNLLLCKDCLVSVSLGLVAQPLATALSARKARAAELATLVADCKAATTAALDTNVPAFDANMQAWATRETARIRAWEAKVVAFVHQSTDECCALVEAVSRTKREGFARIAVQRQALKVTIEELEHGLANLPRAEAEQFSRLGHLTRELESVAYSFGSGKIKMPHPSSVLRWQATPTLATEFDDDAVSKAKSGFPHLPTALRRLLSAKDCRPSRLAPLNSKALKFDAFLFEEGRQALPHMPDSLANIRTISTGDLRVNVFAAVSDDTIVVGFHEPTPPQLWDIATGCLVRCFEGTISNCRAIATLPCWRVALGTGGAVHGVVTYEVESGARLQHLRGNGGGLYGIGYADGHMITSCTGHNLCVFEEDAKGEFTLKATFRTHGKPLGALTVLPGSLAAMNCEEPNHIEVWDWKAGKCVTTILNPHGRQYGTAVLPDGRLLAIGYVNGAMTGDPLDWGKAVAVAGPESCGWYVIATDDGSFVTSDRDGVTRVWRDGACVGTFPGACRYGYSGNSLAIVGGSRIVAVALSWRGFLVIEQ